MAEYNPDAEYIQALKEERDDWARKHAAAETALASARSRIEQLENELKRGPTKTATYNSYRSMIDRCTNPNNKAWHRYGGRGISVCDRWRESYQAFLDDMGQKPVNLSIDRIDNDGNYEPSNCRWATHEQQMRNRASKRVTKYLGVRQLANGTFCARRRGEWLGAYATPEEASAAYEADRNASRAAQKKRAKRWLKEHP